MKILTKYCLSLFLVLSVCFISGAQTSASPTYTPAEQKVADIPLVNFLLQFYENKEKNVRNRYQRSVSIKTKKTPDQAFKYYWIQVMDYQQKNDSVLYNFYVDPGYSQVRYLDVPSNKLLSLQEWDDQIKKQALQKRP